MTKNNPIYLHDILKGKSVVDPEYWKHVKEEENEIKQNPEDFFRKRYVCEFPKEIKK